MMAQFVFCVTRIGTREAPSSSYNTQNETGVVDLASLLASSIQGLEAIRNKHR